MKQVLLLSVAFFFIALNAIGQDAKIQRVEIEAKVKSDNYRIVSVGENGVMVFSELKETERSSEGRNRVWSVTNYDTDFKENWSNEIGVSKGAVLDQYTYKDDYLYLMFSETGKNSNDVHAFKLNVTDGRYKEVRGSRPFMQINDFIAQDDKIFFGGNTHPSPGQVTTR